MIPLHPIIEYVVTWGPMDGRSIRFHRHVRGWWRSRLIAVGRVLHGNKVRVDRVCVRCEGLHARVEQLSRELTVLRIERGDR